MSPYLISRSKRLPECPKHRTPLLLKNGRFGPFYSCEKLRECDVCASKSEQDGFYYVTTQPIRSARILAHNAFDVIWKGGYMPRKEAYRWLRGEMNLTKDQCHIQHMNEAGCETVIRLSSIKVASLRQTAAEGVAV